MPQKKKDAAGELAENLLRVLQSQRTLGADSYPLTLKHLAELTDPMASPEQIEKGIGRKEFSTHALVALKKNAQSPVALKNDLAQLATSSHLLELVLETVCTPANPAQSISKLKNKVPALKAPFEEAINRQVQENTLPQTVGCLRIKGKVQLYLRRMPPQLPPKALAVELSENFVSVLQKQRHLGGESYPLPMKKLVELTARSAAPNVVKNAMTSEPFKSQALIAVKNKKNNLDWPVALASDRDRLAASPILLEFLLTVARTKKTHAFTVSELKGKVIPELQQPFEEAINKQVESSTLPGSVGCKKLLFLLSDLNEGQQKDNASVPVPTPLDKTSVSGPVSSNRATGFAKAFDEAFTELDRQHGSHNFVSLVDLRRILPFDRATFDTELRNQRIAGRYSLSAAEGRHGISPAERDAGIHEEGTLLLFVSRKSP